VAAGDDASHALWVPLEDVLDHPEALFEDHGDIVRHFTR
jgi:bifunctional NMN adenylyltransferase/nudix hydrolase